MTHIRFDTSDAEMVRHLQPEGEGWWRYDIHVPGWGYLQGRINGTEEYAIDRLRNRIEGL